MHTGVIGQGQTVIQGAPGPSAVSAPEYATVSDKSTLADKSSPRVKSGRRRRRVDDEGGDPGAWRAETSPGIRRGRHQRRHGGLVRVGGAIGGVAGPHPVKIGAGREHDVSERRRVGWHLGELSVGSGGRPSLDPEIVLIVAIV